MGKEDSRDQGPLRPEKAYRSNYDEAVPLLEEDSSAEHGHRVVEGWRLASNEGGIYQLFRIRTDSEGNPVTNEDGSIAVDRRVMSEKELQDGIKEARALQDIQRIERQEELDKEQGEEKDQRQEERIDQVKFIMGKQAILGQRGDIDIKKIK